MRGRSGERGQVLPLFAAGMAVVLLGFTALVLDAGRGMLVRRQLQSSADAAALAGAHELPNGAAAAVSAATAYAAGGKNPVPQASGVTATVTTRCLASTPGCAKPNVVAVTERGTVTTTFAKIVGIGSYTVKATSTASRSVTTSPIDVALVLDRTGSMAGQMSSLVAGAQAFLDALDPSLARVALVVLPPAPAGAGWCNRSDQCDYYPAGDGGYVVEHLTNDFARLKTDVGALAAEGSTSYKQALTAARDELTQYGRSTAKKVIVFETDGAANTVPDSAYLQPLSWLDLGQQSIPTGWPAAGRSDDVDRPCGSAVDFARSIAPTIGVYTVGFHLSSDQTCYQAPHRTWSGSVGYRTAGGVAEQGITASSAVQQIASVTGGLSFLQEEGSKLAQTFAQVATQLSGTKLVPDDS